MEGSTGYGAKVAIPRLKRPDDQVVASAKPPRVRSETLNKACTRCRKRKTKCSGTRPRCTNCEKQGDQCYYEQPRRDRFRDAIHKSDLLTNLLKDIRGSLDEERGRMIDDALHEFDDETSPSTPSAPARSMGKTRSQSADTEEPYEAQVSASVGSNEDLDFLDEDVLGDEGPSVTGYLGRNSQVQWMRTLQRKLDEIQAEPPDLTYAPLGSSEEASTKRAVAVHARQRMYGRARPLRDYYFYLDNDRLDEWEDFGTNVVPPIETAERLLDIYRKTVHPPFRILDDQFGNQLHAYYDRLEQGTAMNVSPKWKAILNLVFAIAARFSHLAGVNWQGDDCNHFVYMSRAVHLLELQKITAMVGPPDHNMIQATGLLSFYYLTIGHVSRAWFTIGIALRHAQAAAFQLRNEDPAVPLVKKRLIAQTWWALHSIECILTSITGRPRVIHMKDCTVQLVADLSKHAAKKNRTMQQTRKDSDGAAPSSSATAEHLNYSSSLDTFLDSWTKLDIIQHKSLTNIYSARMASGAWQDTHRAIASLIDELDEWALEALPQKHFATATTMGVSQQREQLLLYFYYQSTKMCITRPCLCRLDQRLKGQSEESARFNQQQADVCIQAALDLTAQLTPPRDAQWIYENGPWWSNVHIIMQALTVMLLELAQNTSSLSQNPSLLISSVEILVEWLKILKTVDGVAANAYNVVCETLSNHKHFASNLTPQGVMQQPPGQPSNPYPSTSAGAFFSADSQQFPDPNHSTVSFNDNFYTNPNEGNFEFDNLQYRQTQYPNFQGNQFSTLFDQEMDYDLGTDSANFEGWDPISGQPKQHPPQ